MSPATLKIVATIVAGLCGAAAMQWPQYATALTALATGILTAVHVPRPGDTKAAP